MLACKFHFIFYFYLPLKTCNFNYSNLLLINFSVGKRHCNHQSQPHQWYLLKLTNYIKIKCLYEVIFFLNSIAYLDHNIHPLPSAPPPPFLLGVWAFFQILKKWGLDSISDFRRGLLGKRDVTFIRENCSCYIKNKLKSEIFNEKRSL